MLRYLIFVIDVDSLDLKYSKSVLLKIYSFNEPIAKKDLGKVVKSHQVLDNLLINLEKDGYIHISSNIVGPRVFKISLTDKGRHHLYNNNIKILINIVILFLHIFITLYPKN